MISQADLDAIRAERDRLVAERLTAHNAGRPMMRFLSGPVPALLDAYEELRTLARELAEALDICWKVARPAATLDHASLTMARAASLLEAEA